MTCLRLHTVLVSFPDFRVENGTLYGTLTCPDYIRCHGSSMSYSVPVSVLWEWGGGGLGGMVLNWGGGGGGVGGEGMVLNWGGAGGWSTIPCSLSPPCGLFVM